MKPETALARTAARGGRYEIWTPSTGAVGFTAQDAAAALAGAPPMGARLMMVKYGCGTPSDERQIAIELGFTVASLVEAPRNSTIAGISIMEGVVAEAIAPVICKKCDGIRWVKVGRKWETCEACLGTGKAAWPNARRARECGVHPEVLRTTAWGTIYHDAWNILMKQEEIAYLHMAKRLRGS